MNAGLHAKNSTLGLQIQLYDCYHHCWQYISSSLHDIIFMINIVENFIKIGKICCLPKVQKTNHITKACYELNGI